MLNSHEAGIDDNVMRIIKSPAKKCKTIEESKQILLTKCIDIMNKAKAIEDLSRPRVDPFAL